MEFIDDNENNYHVAEVVENFCRVSFGSVSLWLFDGVFWRRNQQSVSNMRNNFFVLLLQFVQSSHWVKVKYFNINTKYFNKNYANLLIWSKRNTAG